MFSFRYDYHFMPFLCARVDKGVFVHAWSALGFGVDIPAGNF
jgi:hypothetical protein